MEAQFPYLNKVNRAYLDDNHFITAELILEFELNKIQINDIGKKLEKYLEKIFKENLNF